MEKAMDSVHNQANSAFVNFRDFFSKQKEGVEQGLNLIPRLEYAELGFCSDQINVLERHCSKLSSVQKKLEDGFTTDEITNATRLKFIHDRVEVSAYSALAEAVESMKLKPTSDGVTPITIEQSKAILHKHIKKAAHTEMRSDTGYVKVRDQYLNKKQIEPVIERVNWIIQDRDSKLTNATYQTLDELVRNLDKHNSEVNKILFDAWGVPESHQNHLEEIKKKSNFEMPK